MTWNAQTRTILFIKGKLKLTLSFLNRSLLHNYYLYHWLEVVVLLDSFELCQLTSELPNLHWNVNVDMNSYIAWRRQLQWRIEECRGGVTHESPLTSTLTITSHDRRARHHWTIGNRASFAFTRHLIRAAILFFAGSVFISATQCLVLAPKWKASFSGSCPTAKRCTIATFTGRWNCIGFAMGAVVLKMGFFLPFCFVFDPSDTGPNFPFCLILPLRGLTRSREKNSCGFFGWEKV